LFRFNYGKSTLIALLFFLSVGVHGALAQSNSDVAVPNADAGKAQLDRINKIDEQFVVGRVVAVKPLQVNKELLKGTGMVSKREMVTVEVMEGQFKGLTAEIPNEITDNPAYNVLVKPGGEVILSVVSSSGKEPEVNIADYHRVPALAWLALAFLVTFLVFGGRHGLKSLAGLFVSVLLIALVLLPLSLQGVAPLLTAVVISFLTTTVTIVLVAGFTRKAAAAIIGTIGGVIIAGVAAQLVIQSAPLTGLSSEEAQILRGSVLNQPPVFYTGLLAAGMLIGALGVIMDVGISVASAVHEVAKTDRTLSGRQLYRSGMNVGRDIMGTMTSTLVLAYAGSALPLLLLAHQVPGTKLLNLDLVATEVAAALSGSLGLVCTIPLTALFAAMLMSRESQVENSALLNLGNPEEAQANPKKKLSKLKRKD
jgi:uncharacterized membrane protein